MPTSATITTVYNMALDIVVEAPISVIGNDSPYARWLNRNFSPVVEAALREQPWNFACELHQLNKDPTKPPFRWQNRYSLPPGWLRVLPPTQCGKRNGRPVAHEVKGNYIMANRDSAFDVECVMNIQEPGQWDSLFLTLIAARLAQGMARRFTAKTSFLQLAMKLASDALDTAQEINAFEGSIAPADDYDIIRVREGDLGSW